MIHKCADSFVFDRKIGLKCAVLFLKLLRFGRIFGQDYIFFRWFNVQDFTIQQDRDSELLGRHLIRSNRQYGLLDVLARALDRWLELNVFRSSLLGPFELNTVH